ncbi:MAG TPA: arginine--tRNA ligase [Ktedonobacterales bacterium]
MPQKTANGGTEPQPGDSTMANGDLIERLTGLLRDAAAAYIREEGLAADPATLPFDVRPTAQASFGDYGMPLMPWAGKNRLGRPPMQIAEGVAKQVRAANSPIIREVSVAAPGFLNITFHQPSVGQGVMARVASAGEHFGASKANAGVKVVVEHTAINSNKAAHVGHLRNSCVGDTAARMLRAQGYTVEVQNYIDDTGVQVADVIVGRELIKRGELEVEGGAEQLPGESFDYYCSRVYVAVGKAYEQRPELIEMRRSVLHSIEHGGVHEPGQPDYAALAAELSHAIVQAHLKTMSRLNIFYNLITWESAILGAGLWRHTFEMLRDSGILKKPETGPAKGAWILPFGEGDSQTDDGERTSDKILVKSDGTATYTGKDIATQLWKFGLSDDPRIGVRFYFLAWGKQANGDPLYSMAANATPAEAKKSVSPKRFGHANRVVNVIDVRQSYPQQVVYESLRRLGYVEQADNSRHLAYEVVALSPAAAASLGIDTSDNRSSYAMSGRKGIEIKADDLINVAIERLLAPREAADGARASTPPMSRETAATLATSAIRYFMVRFDLQQMIVLDIEQALRPNGDSGVYLQYAHARAQSILRRLDEAGYTPPTTLDTLPESLDQSEWDLLRHIDAWPRALTEAADLLEPHRVAAYAFDLATRFNDFYDHTPPVLRETDEAVKAFRATLVRTTAQALANTLNTLGLQPLDRL